MEFRSSWYYEFLEASVWIYLVAEDSPLHEIVQMLEKVEVSWQEIWWIWWMRQGFVSYLVQPLRRWLCDMWSGIVVQMNAFFYWPILCTRVATFDTLRWYHDSIFLLFYFYQNSELFSREAGPSGEYDPHNLCSAHNINRRSLWFANRKRTTIISSTIRSFHLTFNINNAKI